MEPKLFSDPKIPQTRICETCQKEKPLTEFEKFKTGGRRSVCKRCYYDARKYTTETQRQEKLEEGIHRLIAAAKHDVIRTPGVAEICAMMFELGGGVKSVCERWWEQIEAAIKNKAGSKTVLDQFGALFKMALAVEQERREQMDWESVSDADLKDAVERLAYKIYDPAKHNAESA